MLSLFYFNNCNKNKQPEPYNKLKHCPLTARESDQARLREGGPGENRQRGPNEGKDFSPRQRGTRDDSDLSLRHRDEHREVRHMKRNSSLVTMARLSLGSGHPDFIIPNQGK